MFTMAHCKNNKHKNNGYIYILSYLYFKTYMAYGSVITVLNWLVSN